MFFCLQGTRFRYMFVVVQVLHRLYLGSKGRLMEMVLQEQR